MPNYYNEEDLNQAYKDGYEEGRREGYGVGYDDGSEEMSSEEQATENLLYCADGRVIDLSNGHEIAGYYSNGEFYKHEFDEIFYKILDFIQEKKREALHKYSPLLDDNEMYHLQGVSKGLSDVDAFCRNLRLSMEINKHGGGTLYEEGQE